MCVCGMHAVRAYLLDEVDFDGLFFEKECLRTVRACLLVTWVLCFAVGGEGGDLFWAEKRSPRPLNGSGACVCVCVCACVCVCVCVS